MRTPKQDSQAAVDKSSSEQGSGILSTRGTVDNRQHELEQLVVKMLYPSKEGGTTVSMTRVREATAVINAHTQKLLAEELTEIVAKNTDTMLGTTDADGVFEDVCDRIATLTNQQDKGASMHECKIDSHVPAGDGEACSCGYFVKATE